MDTWIAEAPMKPINCSDQFTPYSFPDEMFAQRRQPEFGVAASPWRLDITDWLFLHAENRDLLPVGFFDNTADDLAFKAVRVPSVWQRFGYGEPLSLQYDVEIARAQGEKSFFERRLASLSSDYKNDDIGVYRAHIDIPAHYSDRSLYLVLGGVCGRFEVYLNEKQIASADSVFSPCKFPLAGSIKAGHNILTLLVHRFDSVTAGLGNFKDGTFGFSGIFRTASIVADSLVEIRSVFVKTDWTGPVFGAEPGASAFMDVSIKLFNHTDLPVPVQLEYKLIAVFDEYDIYNLPEIRLRAEHSGEATIESLRTLTVGNRLLVRGIFPWSHATPNLYDLIIILKDAAGRIIAIQKRRIGFRTLRESDHRMIVNDYPVSVKAIRYFSFDPQFGLSVPPERLKEDVLLMKQAHLNTVLMPHFPADPQFFDLCDRYGLYVICPLDKKDPGASVESFGTHPCMLAWSLKLDSKDESMLDDVERMLNEESPVPFLYWLFRDTGTVSEFDPFHPDTGALFGEWQDICVDRGFRSKAATASSTEQSPEQGGFDVMIPEEESSGQTDEGHNGDEIPESETAGLFRQPEPDLKYLHQADLCKGYRGAEVAIAQGIVDAFREKHPEYDEVRRRCQSIDFIISDEDPSRPVIVNTDLHGAAGELDLEWSLLKNGRSIRSGGGVLRSLPPGGEAALSLGFRPDDLNSAEEVNPDDTDLTHGLPTEWLLNIRICHVDPGLWYPIGYEEAVCQTVIAKDLRDTPETTVREIPKSDNAAETASEETTDVGIDQEIVLVSESSNVTCTEEGNDQIIDFGGARAVISKEHGGMTQLAIGGQPVLRGRMEPFLYRASTNAERYYVPLKVRPRLFARKTTWRAIQKKLHFNKLQSRTEDGSLILCSEYRCHALKGPVFVEYRFDPDGRFKISLSFQSRNKPLRYGLHIGVPSEADHFLWYGFGPGGLFEEESWSPFLGVYEAHSADLFHHYARPSENGAHPDTRVLMVVAPENRGLRILRSDNLRFTFTATPYMPEHIDDSRHDERLPRPEGAELFLDFEYDFAKDVRKQRRQLSGLRRYGGTFIFETSSGRTEEI